MRATDSPSVAAAVCGLLESLGVRRAYGVTGGPIAPICDALGRSSLEPMHCRHESGAAFAALEDSLASGALTAVFVTTGPGITNALTGMCAARWEGARVLLISASTSPPEAGRRAFQETSSATLPQGGLFGPGPIFDGAWRLDDPSVLPVIAAEIARGLTRAQGWVGHLSVPIGVQLESCAPVTAPRVLAPPLLDAVGLARCADLLAGSDFAIWAGFGARGAAAEVRRLAEHTGAAVLCSPRGKGVIPEDHPQYVGVTGFGGHSEVKDYLASFHPEHLLVLGSRLGEFTSFWDPAFVPVGGFVHVDVDPAVPGASFPQARTLGVRAEIAAFASALVERLPQRLVRPAYGPPARDREPPQRPDGPVRPELLMHAVQRWVVERAGAPVLTDAGNAFAWGSYALRVSRPGQYRTSTGWGAMGHATSGVVGAARGRGGVAVALVGDGAMLMQSEVSTAVQYGVPAAWIVLNDGAYGMIAQGMRAQGFRPLETDLPKTDFCAWARALGAAGVRVERETELDAALSRIASLTGPLVVDVRVDPSEPAPFLKRVQSLIRQTTHTEES
ncbi:MAG TPA: thiamine pyrophosphate-dependent enzyme [Myxococcota bacterium]|nr:thiamine pyrophosphate-dependent enzyme [Myxococcota bacterium]